MPIDPKVEQVARAMCKAVGRDPDTMTPRSGFKEDENNLIPRWYFEVEWAKRAIAANEFFMAWGTEE